MKLLVSACLLGVGCRYDGKQKTNTAILKEMEKHTLIPICPEIMGGLPTPRVPSERKENCVITKNGGDVTAEYIKGAEETLALAQKFRVDGAILKARSPSCGRGKIYDGSFCGRLIDGNGVTAELLLKNGYSVWTEEDLPD